MSTMLGRRALHVYAGLVGLFLILPTLFVVPMSFNGNGVLGLPTGEWTVRWYREVVTSAEWRDAAWTSFKIALLTSAIATPLGTLIAVSLARGRFRGKAVINALVLSPMIIPVVVIAIGIYTTFIRWGLTGSILGLALAHTVLAIPFVIVAVAASARQLDENLEAAAAGLGARPATVFWRITLPLLRPGVIAGALFAFVTSWDEVVVAIFLTSPDVRTLPVLMWTQLRSQVTPALASVGTILVLISTLALFALHLLRKDDTDD